MAEVPTVEAAVAAIHALHNDPDPARKKAANDWLTGFQESPHAWTVADAMLCAEGKPMEVTIMAVQTLHRKMQRDFGKLPPDAHIGLRDNVMAHLLRFKAGPQLMLTQVSLSLAAFAVQCEQWTDVVPHVIAALGEDLAAQPCLLQVMKVLPEEIWNNDLNVSNQRRDAFSAQLGAHFRDVSGFLCTMFEGAAASGAAAQARVIECYTAWLRVCPEDVPLSEVAQNPIVPMVFQAIANEEMSDACTDCIVYLIGMSSRPDGAELAQELVPAVMGLRPLHAQVTDRPEPRLITTSVLWAT